MPTLNSISCARVASLSALALFGWSLAQAQVTPDPAPVCPESVKAEAEKEISASENLPDTERSAEEARIYEKYRFCLQDAQLTPPSDTFFVAARRCGASVSQLGSLFFEEMPCCGYDPQRRLFACPVTIKQRFGYGPAPLPGSREHVLTCVANNFNVLVPVALDSVHLANEMWGQQPTWQFAVIAAADQNLDTIYPMNGTTRRARSILSWGLVPTNCNYQPIWGHAINYRIRRDQ